METNSSWPLLRWGLEHPYHYTGPICQNTNPLLLFLKAAPHTGSCKTTCTASVHSTFSFPMSTPIETPEKLSIDGLRKPKWCVRCVSCFSANEGQQLKTAKLKLCASLCPCQDTTQRSDQCISSAPIPSTLGRWHSRAASNFSQWWMGWWTRGEGWWTPIRGLLWDYYQWGTSWNICRPVIHHRTTSEAVGGNDGFNREVSGREADTRQHLFRFSSLYFVITWSKW